MPEFQNVCVVGLGYIGLPTAAVFARAGVRVRGVDVNADAVDTINQGLIHIVEPDLDQVVADVVASGHLQAALTPAAADAFLIAVPTPFKGDDHSPDLSYIQAACQAIAPVLAPGNLVVLESTSPVGATEQMVEWLAAARPDLRFPGQGGDHDVHVAYCPERVLPGQILRELVNNDRIIGGITPACADRAKALYQTFVTGQCAVTNARTAEMAKLTENSFRDVNIAFANELSIIADRLGINVQDLIGLANLHPRVNILQPGPGVGGHCIAVDPWFIVNKTPDLANIIRTAREVNDAKPHWVVDQVLASHTAGDPIIAYGLAYKPDVDDMRESPAIEVVQALQARAPAGTVIHVVEPFIDALPKGLTGVTLTALDSSLTGDATRVLLVPHQPFKAVSDDLRRLGAQDYCNGLA